MHKLISLIIALGAIMGLASCSPTIQGDAPTTVDNVSIPLSDIFPPTTVNAPAVELDYVAPEVTTTPAPEAPETPVYPVEALPETETEWEVYAPEYITYEPVAPVQTYQTYVAPVVPVAPETVTAAPETVTASPEVVAVDASTYQTTGVEWIDVEFDRYGQTIPAGIHFQLTNELNCGAVLSTSGMGGCTHFLEDGSRYITVSPELAYTPEGTHVLWHEVGHAVLDTVDECAAEAYAHKFSDPNLWSYPQCAGL